MIGLGTIINTAAIVAAGLLGRLFSRLFSSAAQDALSKACGVSVLFIGAAGTLEGMLHIQNGHIVSSRAMFLTLCLALGTAAGEWLDIEGAFVRLGEWLKRKTGNARDAGFVHAFVTATLTVCIGAMAIVGALQDGLRGDWSVLALKAVLDFVIIAVMTASLGKGAAFSALPVLVFQGSITALARLAAPIFSPAVLDNISLIGSALIFCIGLNLLRREKLRVANMLPALLLAAAAQALPWTL